MESRTHTEGNPSMVKAKKKYKFNPDYAIPPGESVREFVRSRNMTDKEFAIRAGLTVQSLNRIFKGEQPISYETANKLELVTDRPASFWNNLEANYRELLSKFQEQEQLRADLEWLREIPVNELIDIGVIKPFKAKVELLREVLGFFGVSSVSAWYHLWHNPEFAARRSDCFETLPGPTATWLRLGELKAEQISTNPYNRKTFFEALLTIRTMTCDKHNEFLPKMRLLCAEAGVALAMIPEMKKVPWSGASRWLNKDKAMILVNLRGKSEDKFWFTFFHESGHILKGSKLKLYINDKSCNDEDEDVADRFAADILIPSKWNEKISGLKTYEEIFELAKKLKISPGIVAGRYQRLTKQWNYFKRAQRKFVWVKQDTEV